MYFIVLYFDVTLLPVEVDNFKFLKFAALTKSQIEDFNKQRVFITPDNMASLNRGTYIDDGILNAVFSILVQVLGSYQVLSTHIIPLIATYSVLSKAKSPDKIRIAEVKVFVAKFCDQRMHTCH